MFQSLPDLRARQLAVGFFYVMTREKRKMEKRNMRWQLMFYDILILLVVDLLLLVFYRSDDGLSWQGILTHGAITFVCVFAARIGGSIYRQIWRYGGIQCYIRLLVVDGCAFLVNLLLVKVVAPLVAPIEQITFSRMLSIAGMNLLAALAMRMFYRYAFKCGGTDTLLGRVLRLLLRLCAGEHFDFENVEAEHRIKIAIVGAGRVGVTLAEELLANPAASYVPGASSM